MEGRNTRFSFYPSFQHINNQRQRVRVSRNERHLHIRNGAATRAGVVQGRPWVQAFILGTMQVRIGKSADCVP
eukprot:3376456-Ditylum_brightwellii.AAC.1